MFGRSTSVAARLLEPAQRPVRTPGGLTVCGDHRDNASIDGALASCDVIGGTAPTRVAAALSAVRARVDADRRGAEAD